VITLVKSFLSLAQLIFAVRLFVSPGAMKRSDRPLNEVPHPPLALICSGAVPALRISKEHSMALLLRQIGSSVIVAFSHTHLAFLSMTIGLRPLFTARADFAPALSSFALRIPFLGSGRGFFAAGVSLGFGWDSFAAGAVLGFGWAKSSPVIKAATSKADAPHRNRRGAVRRVIR